MSAFKGLNRPDVFLTDYVSRKHWQVSGSEFRKLGISKYVAISGSIPYYISDADIEPIYRGDTQFESGSYNCRLAYESLRTSFYEGVEQDGSVTGTYDPSLQTTVTVPGARNIADRVLVYSLPRKLIGTQLELQSVKISGGISEIVDSEGALISGGRIVGDIIYTKGLIIITDPTLVQNYDILVNENIQFTSCVPIFTYNVNCVVADREYNYTYNPSVPDNLIGNKEFTPYVTSIGLYNSTNELLAVAKLSKPIKKAANVDMTFKVQVDIG